jgi:hypothetical protein
LLTKSGSYSPCSEYAAAASTKFVDTFVTDRPTCFTSFGSRPSACEMRFCTSTAATSRFLDTSKVTVIPHDPSLPLEEVMYCIPSTPLIACSSGIVTAVSTVCAFAPL